MSCLSSGRALAHGRSVSLAPAAGNELGELVIAVLVAADGFAAGVANPKTAVFFIAVLPEFVNRSAGQVTAQMLLLGTVFVLIAAVSNTAWSLAARAARDWLGRSPGRLEAPGGAGGLAMIGLGVTIALTGRKD